MRHLGNASLRPLSQKLRRDMTKEERRLWYDFLRSQPVPFHRQKVIGNYIVDFYCAKAHLAIELDGSQHYEDKALERDAKRTADLRALGISVVRFPNNAVNRRFEGVCEWIDICVHAGLENKPMPTVVMEGIT